MTALHPWRVPMSVTSTGVAFPQALEARHRQFLSFLALRPNSEWPYGLEDTIAQAAMAWAQDLPEPQRLTELLEGRTVIGVLLQGLPLALSHFSEKTDRLALPHDAAHPWPLAAAQLPWREQLAGWLVAQGVDPWQPDEAGHDALDWAIHRGARSVVQQLLHHPKAPSLEALQARTLKVGGKPMPWLHHAVFQGQVGLARDLLDAGWSASALDSRGWTALHWVSHPVMAQAMDAEWRQTTAQDREAIFSAWHTRQTKKLWPRNAEPEWLQACETSVRKAHGSERSAKDGQEEALRRRAMEWLAIKASAKTHLGDLGTWDDQRRARWEDEFLTLWDRRWTVERGYARGQWSLPMAAVWGIFRGEGSGETLALALRPLIQALGQQPDDARDAWLDEPIRAGLTPRAWLHWMAEGFARTSFRKDERGGGLRPLLGQEQDECLAQLTVLSQWCLHRHGQPLGDPTQVLWQHAQHAFFALDSSEGAAWRALLSGAWTPLFQAELPRAARSPSSPVWTIGVNVLARTTLPRNRLIEFAAAAKTLASQTDEAEEPALKQAFAGLLAIAGKPFDAFDGTTQYRRDVELATKKEMWDALRVFFFHPSAAFAVPARCPVMLDAQALKDVPAFCNRLGLSPEDFPVSPQAWHTFLEPFVVKEALEALLEEGAKPHPTRARQRL